MERDNGDVGREIAALRAELEGVKRRLDVIERRTRAALDDDSDVADVPPVPVVPADGGAHDAHTPALPLVGRALLVLAGAYLLRAVTDGGVVGATAGASLGLAYAAFWLAWADRTGRQDGARATTYGLVAILIAYPLAWEASLRLHAFTPTVGAAALVTTLFAALVVARRRRLGALARIALALASVAGPALACAGARAFLCVAVAYAVAAAAEIFALDEDFAGSRWLPALALDTMVLITVFLSVRPDLFADPAAAPSPSTAALLAALLPLAFFGAVVARTLAGRTVGIYDAAQGLAVTAVGLTGAAWALSAAHTSRAPVGLVALAVGAIAYAVAFRFAARSAGRDPAGARHFHYHVTVAALASVAGLCILLDGDPRAVVLAALAVVAAVISLRTGRLSLLLHAALYLVVAALAAAVPLHAATALIGGAIAAPTLGALAVAACAFACELLAARIGARDPKSHPYLVATVATSAAGVVALFVVGVAARAVDALGLDGGFAASLRTTLLATTAVLAALAGRLGRRELARLAYPALALGAIKLAVDDLRVGRPATLFISLAVLGAASLLCPHLLRKPR